MADREEKFGVVIEAKDKTAPVLNTFLGRLESAGRQGAKLLTGPMRGAARVLEGAFSGITSGKLFFGLQNVRTLVDGIQKVGERLERGNRLNEMTAGLQRLIGAESIGGATTFAQKLQGAASHGLTLYDTVQSLNRALKGVNLSGTDLQAIYRYAAINARELDMRTTDIVRNITQGLMVGKTDMLSQVGLITEGLTGVGKAYDAMRGQGAWNALQPMAQQAVIMAKAMGEIRRDIVQAQRMGVTGAPTIVERIGVDLRDVFDRSLAALSDRGSRGWIAGAGRQVETITRGLARMAPQQLLGSLEGLGKAVWASVKAGAGQAGDWIAGKMSGPIGRSITDALKHPLDTVMTGLSRMQAAMGGSWDAVLTKATSWKDGLLSGFEKIVDSGSSKGTALLTSARSIGTTLLAGLKVVGDGLLDRAEGWADRSGLTTILGKLSSLAERGLVTAVTASLAMTAARAGVRRTILGGAGRAAGGAAGVAAEAAGGMGLARIAGRGAGYAARFGRWLIPAAAGAAEATGLTAAASALAAPVAVVGGTAAAGYFGGKGLGWMLDHGRVDHAFYVQQHSETEARRVWAETRAQLADERRRQTLVADASARNSATILAGAFAKQWVPKATEVYHDSVAWLKKTWGSTSTVTSDAMSWVKRHAGSGFQSLVDFSRRGIKTIADVVKPISDWASKTGRTITSAASQPAGEAGHVLFSGIAPHFSRQTITRRLHQIQQDERMIRRLQRLESGNRRLPGPYEQRARDLAAEETARRQSEGQHVTPQMRREMIQEARKYIVEQGVTESRGKSRTSRPGCRAPRACPAERVSRGRAWTTRRRRWSGLLDGSPRWPARSTCSSRSLTQNLTQAANKFGEAANAIG